MTLSVSSVVEAVSAIYDPGTTNDRRVAASQLIETVKDSSPRDVEQLAYELITQQEVCVAHVGWNFIEHIIKFKWLEMGSDDRLSVRNGCLIHVTSEQMKHAQLRNAAARCIVSMIEHEWPQNWPELFEHLEKIASVSIIHAQMPFIVLQRLIEDVVTMYALENQSRRKDLNNAIAIELPRIFHMAISTLERTDCSSDDDFLHLVRCALCLLGEIMEWAPSKVLEPKLDNILCAVCAFLSTPQFSIYEHAAKCLWKIASRRCVKNDESAVVLTLFGDVPMRTILSLASAAASVGAENIEHYRYLKALCDVLSALGIHLADVWQRPPPNFGMYLAAIEAFLSHPSVCLRNEASAVFVSFITHPKISEDELFNDSLTRIVTAMPRLIEKTGLPSRNDSESSLYSQIDFDDDADFSHCFIQFRDRCLRILRGACVARHLKLLCSIVEHWTKSRCIDSPHSVTDVEWEAMQRFSRTVLSECYNDGLLGSEQLDMFTRLFDGVLYVISACTSQNLVNYLLSVLSSLFIILASHPDRLPPFLNLIRRILSNNGDDSSEEKSMKRHCIAVLLRLTTAFSDAVKDQAESILEVCLAVRSQLSPMQQAACVQVLASLSNLCADFSTQCNFLSCAMQESVAYFMLPEVVSALEDDSAFISFIGFSSPAPLNNDEAQRSSFIFNRRILRSNLSTIEGMLAQVRSVEPPSHPGYQVIRPILPTLFALAERVNSLYEPHSLSLIHPSYGPSVVDITLADRQQLLAAIDPLSPSSARILTEDANSHARSFVSDVTDCIQSITGYLGSAMSAELFSEPQANVWSVQLVSHVSSVPDFRLRYWIRRSWRPFLCSCPESHFMSVRELLRSVLSEMQRRLSLRWEEIAKVESSENEEPSQEQIFAEHMTCILTRETVTLIRSLLRISDSSSAEKKDESKCPIAPHFSRDKVVLEALVALAFLCLTCRDAVSAVKIIPPCRAIVDIVSAHCEEAMAVFMLVRSIQSLQVHGSDEVALGPLLSLVFHIYYSLREGCESLLRVLEQVPQCTIEALQAFDSKILSMRLNKEGVIEKTKREITKKLLRPIIAMTMGEQHRRPVYRRTLPPLAKPGKPLVEEDFTALALIFNVDE